jgi:RNA polymerase sigma-70 factor (ECF subfamily)
MSKRPLRAPTEPSDPATWVDRHGDYLFRYALARLGQPELAEDVVQEAFLGALQSRRRFAGASSERTWLVGILKHKLADHFRRRRREEPAEYAGADSWIDDLFDRRGHWRKWPPRWTNPSAVFENTEFWTIFSQCLRRLPAQLAEAFSLREMDDLPSAKICKVLGISPTNLGVMMHRARLRLWRCLNIHWFSDKKRRR